MSRKKIYECLISGEPLTARQIMERTGLSWQDVHDTIGSMRTRGYVQPTPVTYALTDKGLGTALRAQERKKTVARPLLMARNGQLVNSVFNWRGA